MPFTRRRPTAGGGDNTPHCRVASVTVYVAACRLRAAEDADADVSGGGDGA